MRNFLKEYPVYISIRILMAVFYFLPMHLVLFIGRIIGALQFYLDTKHRTIAYKNLKLVFSKEKNPYEISTILKKNFQCFAQNFAELLCLDRINKVYIEKYVHLEGCKHVDEAFKKGKGVIFTGVHEGSWELSNAAIGLLGYKFFIVAETQKNKLLNALLDKYRQDKGYGIIPVQSMMRQIIKSLKSNEAVGVVIDHGGMQEGILVEFFNRPAYTPTGAIRLGIKFNAALLLGFVYRIGGPHHKLIFLPPIKIEQSGNLEKDLYANLKQINNSIEDFIRERPEEYLWVYKRWKNSPQKSIIILNNGGEDNLRKCREKLEEIKAEHNDYQINLNIIKIDFKKIFLKPILDLCALFSSRYCQGCMGCVKFCLTKNSYNNFIYNYADIIISPLEIKSVARFLARENTAELYFV